MRITSYDVSEEVKTAINSMETLDQVIEYQTANADDARIWWACAAVIAAERNQMAKSQPAEVHTEQEVSTADWAISDEYNDA